MWSSLYLGLKGDTETLGDGTKLLHHLASLDPLIGFVVVVSSGFHQLLTAKPRLLLLRQCALRMCLLSCA
jgi:hypothetical protein